MAELRDPVSAATHQSACAYRLRRVREQLVASDCDAILLYDPLNIRYATDSSNMQVWTMHNDARYVLVPASGDVTLWEFHGCAHLHEGNARIDEIRDAINCSYFVTGPRAADNARRWARTTKSLSCCNAEI